MHTGGAFSVKQGKPWRFTPEKRFFLELRIVALGLAHLLSLLAACHALLTKRDPRSALGWTVALLFLPVIGLVTYLIFGIGRAQSRAERLMRRNAKTAGRYAAPPGRWETRLPDSDAEIMARLGDRITVSPLCGGNRIRPLRNGDEAYPAMLAAINSARKNVYLSTYIFNYGDAAKDFINALANARKRGVDVRVLVDGIGALYSWRKPWRILARKGIRTARFLPPKLFPPNFSINLRCHRKVLVCDHTGFTGGMNIADGNLLRQGRKKHIQDMHFLCEGPIVVQLRNAFLLNWDFCAEEFTRLPAFEAKNAGESICRIVVDGPGNDADVLNDLICGTINAARRIVRIMTPYFLPTHDLMAALRSAAQRGIDVRVILPAKNNLAYMSWATQRILPSLLACGVRVWNQNPPFAHTKLLAVDGYYCQVGSANLDSRSLRLNFELNMEVFDSAFHDELAAFMDSKIASGREITLEELKNQTLPVKLRNSASWIFSPYF